MKMAQNFSHNTKRVLTRNQIIAAAINERIGHNARETFKWKYKTFRIRESKIRQAKLTHKENVYA
jgi:hypothetical protein